MNRLSEMTRVLRFLYHTTMLQRSIAILQQKYRGNCRPPRGPWGLGSCMWVKQTYIHLL